MRGGELIREARKRRGLTQRELAELLGTTQAVIGRWESGSRSPDFDRVVAAIRACGYDLGITIVTPDDDHRRLMTYNLGLTPGERIDKMVAARRGMQKLVASVRRR